MTRARRGYVLAGGQSRRMGRDKARLRVAGGAEMAVSVAAVLRQAGLIPSIVRRGTRGEPAFLFDDGSAVSTLYEPTDGSPHPLWGVVAALADSDDELVLVVPCDLPDLTVDAVQALVGAGGPAVAWDGERLHPLAGVYPRRRAAEAAQAAAAGRSVHAFVADVPRVSVDPAALRNVNRPEDHG